MIAQLAEFVWLLLGLLLLAGLAFTLLLACTFVVFVVAGAISGHRARRRHERRPGYLHPPARGDEYVERGLAQLDEWRSRTHSRRRHG